MGARQLLHLASLALVLASISGMAQELEVELDDGRLYYLECSLQPLAERFVPPLRGNEPNVRRTAVTVEPILWTVPVGHIRQEAEVDLGDRASRLNAYRRFQTRYGRAHLYAITVGGEIRYHWQSARPDRDLGTPEFYGLSPGTYHARVVVSCEDGLHFDGALSFVVSDESLDTRGAEKRRTDLAAARRKLESGKADFYDLRKHVDALASLCDHVLTHQAGRFADIEELVQEWQRALTSLESAPQPGLWQPRRAEETWEEWRSVEHAGKWRKLLEWLSGVVDPDALAEAERLILTPAFGALPGQTKTLRQIAAVKFALTGDVVHTHAALETWAAAGEAQARRAAEAGQVIGTSFDPQRDDWPRELLAAIRPPERETVKTPQLEVRLTMTDPDGQWTPGDEATVQVDLRNRTARELVLRVRYGLVGEHAQQPEPFMTLAPEDAEIPGERTVRIDPRGAAHFSLILRAGHTLTWSAAQGGSWLYRQLAEHPFGDQAKPATEVGFELGPIVALEVREEKAGGLELEHTFALHWADGRAVAVQFPDLREAAGTPPGSAEALAYYRDGDPNDSMPGHPAVRALALRAAIYGRGWDLGAARGAPRMPDDVAEVVENVARFVHDALHPRGAPAGLRPVVTNARALLEGSCGFGIPPSENKAFFICQEHALLFGALLRALGIAVRDVNVQSQPFILSSDDLKSLRSSWQDASNEVYYEGRWHYWGLFAPQGPFRDHVQHYNKWFQAYEVYVGSQAYVSNGLSTRFNIGSFQVGTTSTAVFPTGAWLLSGVWRYQGYGVAGVFTEQASPPLSTWISPYLGTGLSRFLDAGAYWIGIYSPVVGLVEIEGERVGLTEPFEGDPTEWFFNTRSGLIAEIPGAVYLPEGLMLFSDASDPASAQPLPQTLIVPAAAGTPFALRLRSTGSGPVEIRARHLDENGVQSFEPIQLEASPGVSFELSDADLHAQGPRAPHPPRAIPDPTPTPSDPAQATPTDWHDPQWWLQHLRQLTPLDGLFAAMIVVACIILARSHARSRKKRR